MNQVSLTAVCDGQRMIEERLAKWLLMYQDRIKSDELNLTQEIIAKMLGSRRPSISVAASALQMEGLIQYKHDHIKIIDRKGVKSFACECYEAVK